MMVVMPVAGSSWYVNSAKLGGPGNYENAIGDELPRAIEARYPVSQSASQRAIAGISMGGYGALRIAFQRTLRIPDDGETYSIPPGLGEFPIRRVAVRLFADQRYSPPNFMTWPLRVYDTSSFN